MAATSLKSDGASISAWSSFSAEFGIVTVIIGSLEQKEKKEVIYGLHVVKIQLS